MEQVMVIAGSKNDEEIVNKVRNDFDNYKINYRIEYASAHREYQKINELIRESDAEIYIGIAGLSAMLPSFIISQKKDKPVIGVPVNRTDNLENLAAVLSIFEMPKGVPLMYVKAENVACTVKMLLEWRNKK